MKPLIFCTVLLSFVGNISVAYAQEYTIVGKANYGCIEKKDFDDTVKLMSQGDKEAFVQLLGFGINMGVCTMFQPGEPVYASEHSWGAVKVRRKGEVTDYWTFLEAIKK